jgi:hypothetical protein
MAKSEPRIRLEVGLPAVVHARATAEADRRRLSVPSLIAELAEVALIPRDCVTEIASALPRVLEEVRDPETQPAPSGWPGAARKERSIDAHPTRREPVSANPIGGRGPRAAPGCGYSAILKAGRSSRAS